MGCNWNNGQWYITQNNNFVHTSTAPLNTEPIIQNAGAHTLPPRSILISVQAPTKLNTRHVFQLNATDNLPPGIISLAVGHKIDHE